MDWHDLVSFNVSPLELFVRGTLMYWFLLLIFRFVMRRDVGAVGMADVLLIVLIADAAQNAMAGGYESVAEGCVLIGTMIGWNFALDRLSYRYQAVRKLLDPPPLVLVKHGQINWHNMRREAITEEELLAHLRQNGLTSVKEAGLVCMESDGKVSVIPASSKTHDTEVPGAR
jgi:uncharacterized membrane protein YcaP (DUF421 family)